MAKKVFLDTNIIIDFLDHRRSNYGVSRKIVEECMFGNIAGCISETVITNTNYILRKAFTPLQLNEFILGFANFLIVLPFTNQALVDACNSKNKDLEDAILYQIALENDCSYFITTNLSDFVSITQPKLEVIRPDDFLKWYESSTA